MAESSRSQGSQVFRDGLLEGMVCVVSGAGTGLGRETALELARLGATVVGCGRRDEPLAETAALAAELPGTFAHEVLDIREEDAVDSFFDALLERHGRLDVLVNNAGGQFLSPAEAISPKGFRTVIELNVTGTWLMSHAAATKAFIPGGGGKILSVTLSPHNGMPGQFATETLLTKYPPEIVERVAHSIPLGRTGRPEEIAWLLAYLASPAGDFYSGTTITIDGARDNWFGPWPPAEVASESGSLPAERRR
jgi:citronellol/citronellal dehydrogenase